MLSAKYEKLGKPTVNIVYDSVLSVAKKRTLARSESMPYMRMIAIPTTGQDAKISVAKGIVPKIVEALTKPLTEQEEFAGNFEPPKEPRIAFTGTYDQVQEFFLGDMSKYVDTAPHAEYTDGLPVIPPTEDRVARLLGGTSHKPDEVIGQLAPVRGMATVEKVAINAVMAGARPEYMPVLLSLTEAMAKDPGADSATFGGGGSFSNPVVICGPVAKEIGVNSGGPQGSGPAPFIPGVPANMVIGRFMRLMKLNVGGVEPGVNEAKGIGSPFKTSIVIAEANDESPWPQMSSQLGLGFKDKECTVTLFSGWSDLLTGYGPTRIDIGVTKAQLKNPDILARYLTCVAEAATGLTHPTQGLLYMMPPDVAQEINKAGYTVEDVKKWLLEKTVAPWGRVKRQNWYQPWMFKEAALATIQGKNMTLFQRKDFPENAPDDKPVRYFAGLDFITVVVGPGTPLPLAASVVMNAHPAWTVSVDKWR